MIERKLVLEKRSMDHKRERESSPFDNKNQRSTNEDTIAEWTRGSWFLSPDPTMNHSLVTFYHAFSYLFRK
jgi:hypothetical protein